MQSDLEWARAPDVEGCASCPLLHPVRKGTLFQKTQPDLGLHWTQS